MSIQFSNQSVMVTQKEPPIVDFYRPYCISELLPFDFKQKRREVGLCKEVEEFRVLLLIAIEAIHTFHMGELTRFDSFVGENACQVRAFWIALLASRRLDFKEEMDTIREMANRLQMLCEAMSSDAINMKWQTLHALLESQGLMLSMNLELYFIIQSFLLTEVRLPRNQEIIVPSLFCPVKSDPKRLKRFGNVSSMFLEKIVRKYRKFLSDVSVEFIRQQADRLGDQHLIEMVSSEFTLKHNNHLSCSPMFWTYQVILSAALQEKIPLMMHAKFLKKGSEEGYILVDDEWVLFHADDHMTSHFSHKNVQDVNPDQSVVVVQGFVVLQDAQDFCKNDWCIKMKNHSVTKAILAGAADHPQYPHPDIGEIEGVLYQNIEYTKYKSFAKSEGFSLDNPSTFFIRHVYASKIKSCHSRSL